MVLDLKEEGRSIREIAKETHTSSRDIQNILTEAAKEREVTQIRIFNESIAAQAYKLFEEGKRLIDVAIELKLRQPEVMQYHEEYLKLNAMSNFLYIYTKIKEDPRPYVRLHDLIRAAGMSEQHVIRLLILSNEDLPSLQLKYQNLRNEIDSLENDKARSATVFQQLTDQVSYLNKREDELQSSIKELKHEKVEIELEKMKLENFVKDFRYNNRGYNKIRKVARQEVENILSDNRRMLEMALKSLIGSLHLDPKKFEILYYNMSTMEISDDNNEKLIIEQAKKFYDEMLERIPNSVVENVVEAEEDTSNSHSFRSESADLRDDDTR
jgi:predicted nuclease with TOPRIM domain